MKARLALGFVACASWSLAQGAGPTPWKDELLDRLLGRWEATGTSHGLSVPQTIQVDWVLNHQFVRIDQRMTENRPGWGFPYEAFLFIGYDRAQKRYVLHSLTVHGADEPRVVFGERQGDEIKFEAKAGERTVGLRLTWRPESGTWHCVWGFQPAGGEWKTVSDLVLTRAR